jgi:predicted AAA+ superfamily ATPase
MVADRWLPPDRDGWGNAGSDSDKRATNLATNVPPKHRRACHNVCVDHAVSPLGRIVPRRAATTVAEALTDTRVVLVVGARQCGKSTLVDAVALDRGTQRRNLDDDTDRRAAQSDPEGFVDTDAPMVIDEVQRVPELFTAIKSAVDRDGRPGRFLLTGSTRVFGLRPVPDTLVGRIETVELWPFSQGEVDGTPDGFVDAAFAAGPDLRHTGGVDRAGYAARVVRGGFPAALARTEPQRRERFLDSYTDDLATRDISLVSEIEAPHQMRALLRLLAARTAAPLVGNTLAGDLAISARTVHRYLALLEEVFLIKRVPAWSRNISARAVHTPKLAFVDSGVVANLLAADADGLLQPGSPFGPLLENFVLTELARQLTWSRTRASLFHYRTKDGVEVDAVLEDRRGRVIGIEVKAATTVRPEDFRGLNHLADRVGDDFVVGLVLHTGTQTRSFGPQLRSMPISALWEVSGS